jgi:putative endonuclease
LKLLVANTRTEGTQAAKRRRSERHGRLAEWIAAAVLIVRGYRILAMRQRTPAGEIDLIGRRGSRLAFVEVKWRGDAGTLDHAIGPRQAARVARAAEHWVWRQPDLRGCEIGLDCILLAPGRLPRYIANALQPT